MTYATADSFDFRSIAKELVGDRLRNTVARSIRNSRSDGSELPPAEVSARFDRAGSDAFQTPSVLGATIDREGLNNLYAVVPPVYFATFPTAEQARRYAIQGAMAALFITSLILTAAAVS